MKLPYYSVYELEFYINTLDTLTDEYKEKINMLQNLRNEFLEELKSRGDDNG